MNTQEFKQWLQQGNCLNHTKYYILNFLIWQVILFWNLQRFLYYFIYRNKMYCSRATSYFRKKGEDNFVCLLGNCGYERSIMREVGLMLFVACFITIRSREEKKGKNSRIQVLFFCLCCLLNTFHKLFYSGASCNWRDCPLCSIPSVPKLGNSRSRPYSFLWLCIFRMIWHNRCSYTRDSSYIRLQPSIHCNTLHGPRIYFCIPCTRLGSSSTSNRDWLDTRHLEPKLHST